MDGLISTFTSIEISSQRAEIDVMDALRSTKPNGHMRLLEKTRGSNPVLLGLLLVLNVAIPKAGFKIGDVPITFGYLYAVALGILYFPKGISCFMQSNSAAAFLVAYCTWILLFLVTSGYFCGIENMGFYFSMIFGFWVLPVVFLLSFSYDEPYPRALETYLIWSVRFAVLYGIFLFVYKMQTGKFIEIPYLTVNADDVGKMDTKYIQRADDVSKLISTYNNGNIFGVCLLMLIPLYDLLECRPIMKLLARCALILTLSRTVWMVLMLYETFLIRRPVWQRAAVLLIAASGILLMLHLMGTGGEFLADSTLGGRMTVVDQLHISLFPFVSFNYVSEIFWVSVAYFGGVIGVFTFAGLFVLIFLIFQYSEASMPYRRVAVMGVVNFFLCSFVDAAANYIPTMFVFWLTVRVGLLKNGDLHGRHNL
jgi:hypothetical protein